MGTRGPKPAPTNKRVLQGNPGKRAINTLEPKIKLEMLVAPVNLSKSAAVHFNDLAKKLFDARIVTKLDTLALAQLADVLAEIDDVQSDAENKFYMTEARNGSSMQRVSAHYSTLRELRKEARTLFAEFGMTPSSRSRVNVVDDDQGNMFADFDQTIQ